MYYAVKRKGDGNTRLVGWTGKHTEAGVPSTTMRICDMKCWESAAEVYQELRDQPDMAYFRAADLYTKPTDGFKPLWWYYE